jgi:peptide/nickel transport system substrate-binding protein
MRDIGRRRTPSSHASGWPLIAALAAGVVAVAGVWFSFGDSLTGGSGDGTDTYSEAIVGAPSRVNPLFAHLNDTDRDLVSLVFSGLARLSPDGQVLPDLAETWEISEDGRLVTFHLRSGVTFHDGSPFGAADVVFTYGLLGDPELSGDPEQAPLWRQVHCTEADPLTVACELPASFAPLPAYATIGILPKSALEDVGASALFDHEFNQSPIGAGPYRLTQLNDRRATLEAHRPYHLGLPAIDRISLQFFPDTASAAASVVQGETDGLLLDASAGEEEREELSAADGISEYSANRTAYTALYLNNSASPLNETAVRSAIARAIDLEGILDELLGEYATLAVSPIVPGTWAHNPNLERPEHDDDAARDILDTADWTLTEGADVRTRNGVELRISLMTDQDPLREALAGRISDELADIGVGTTVTPEESTNLIQDFLIPRDYQAAIFGWDQGLDPDPYPAWHSSQAGGNGRNLSDYRSDEADRLMEEARLSYNVDSRQSLYYTFQEVFLEDAPSVILYYPVHRYFVRENVNGIELGVLFNAGSRFRNVHEWTVSETSEIGD